jgi:transposase
MDLGGKVERRATLDCGTGPICEFVSPYGVDVTVGVESTYNWYWLIDAMQERGIPCVLGHALYMSRKMSGKHKSDGVDAQGIADLLRTNQFPLAYSYPPAMRGTRDLLRRRHMLVRRRAGTLTHFQCTLHQEGCTEPLRNRLQYKSTRDGLVKLARSADTRKILESDLVYIKGLDALIDDLEKTVLEKADAHNPKHLRSLRTMPGCGDITALTILYEVHTIDRFSRPQQFCSYGRVVRADNSSAGKDYGGSSSDKIGNAHLKWAFSEIGAAMLRVSAPVRLWWSAQSGEHGKVGAHARLRHKIALAVHSMLKHDTVFDVKKFLGEEYMGTVEQASPSHNGTRTPTTPREPNGVIGAAPPVPIASEHIPSQPHTPPVKQISIVNEHPSSGTTPLKKRGRPALPRDASGNIMSLSSSKRSSDNTGPASAAHQGKEKSGPDSKPSLRIAPPASSVARNQLHGESPRRGRPPLPRDTQGRIIRHGDNRAPVAVSTAIAPPCEPSGQWKPQQIANHLSSLPQGDLANLLLSLLSNLTTGAASPAHNWSSQGPGSSSQPPSRLIGAAPVVSTATTGAQG